MPTRNIYEIDKNGMTIGLSNGILMTPDIESYNVEWQNAEFVTIPQDIERKSGMDTNIQRAKI